MRPFLHMTVLSMRYFLSRRWMVLVSRTYVFAIGKSSYYDVSFNRIGFFFL